MSRLLAIDPGCTESAWRFDIKTVSEANQREVCGIMKASRFGACNTAPALTTSPDLEAMMAKASLTNLYSLDNLPTATRPTDPRFLDLTGRKIGRLTVLAFAGQRRWFCQCDCGKIIRTYSSNLRDGKTSSCGCLHRERAGEAKRTHGATGTLEYEIYRSAKQRCINPNSSRYKYYGGRGIEFRFDSFEEFIAALGPRPSRKHSVDRIDNDGHYETGNVRWATQSEQRLNARRPNK